MENNEAIKQLLFIGNGFDLACGLKSRYNDFFYDLYKENPQNYRITEKKIIGLNYLRGWLNLTKNQLWDGLM